MRFVVGLESVWGLGKITWSPASRPMASALEAVILSIILFSSALVSGVGTTWPLPPATPPANSRIHAEHLGSGISFWRSFGVAIAAFGFHDRAYSSPAKISGGARPTRSVLPRAIMPHKILHIVAVLDREPRVLVHAHVQKHVARHKLLWPDHSLPPNAKPGDVCARHQDFDHGLHNDDLGLSFYG